LSNSFPSLFVGSIVGAAALVPVALLLHKDFLERPRKNNPKRISSFFDLNEFAQAGSLSAYAKLYAFVICGALWAGYFALCMSDGTAAAAEDIVEKVLIGSENEFAKFTAALLKNNRVFSAPISLLILLITSLPLFFPFLAKLNNILKYSAQAGIAFDNTCNTLVNIAANDVIRANKHTEFLQGIDAYPREIIHSEDRNARLRYVLLDEAIITAHSDGLIDALRKILEERGVPSSLKSPPPPVKVSYILLMFALYVFFGIIYCVFIVTIGHNWCGNVDCNKPILGSFVFPGATDNEKIWEATTSVLIDYYTFSVQISIPFLIGIALYERKKKSSSEAITFEDNFIPVAGMQVIWSMIGAGFAILSVSMYQSHFDFLNFQNLLQLLISLSFAPVATVMWVWLNGKEIPRPLLVFIAAVPAALLYGFMGFCYSCLGQRMNPNFEQLDVDWAAQCFYIIVACGVLRVVLGEASPAIAYPGPNRG
jgi:hypothetical protein